MLKPTVDGASIRHAISMLKDLDENAQKNLAREMRTALANVAQTVAHEVPTDAPLSGMKDNGYSRLRWGQVGKPTVHLTPGKQRGMKGLVSIRINVKPDAGYRMAELAGSKNRVTQERGRIMIQKLQERFPYKGKSGRFAFKKFREVRPEVMDTAKEILNKYLEIVNRSI